MSGLSIIAQARRPVPPEAYSVPMNILLAILRRCALPAVLLIVPAAWLPAAPPGFVPARPATQPVEQAPQPRQSESGTPTLRGDMALPEQDKYYDDTNPADPVLQKANQALRGFPLDRIGYIDWMKALRDGTIKPRSSLTGVGEMEVLDLDVIMRDTKEMPFVRFPHKSHTLWLACKNCHDGIFVAKAGANDVSMGEIFRGRYCGVCHDRVAFVTWFSCDRCHAVPQQAATQK